ncbi:MAG: glycosyltransferase family 39 protein [Bacteroidales bacterium]|nr:glycosyltransferase family 39 protein [Bacteroidales bacterium]
MKRNVFSTEPRIRGEFLLIATIFVVLFDFTERGDSFDTHLYFEAGSRLLDGKMDCLRTPVYPLILQFSLLLFGSGGAGVFVTVLQSVLHLLSVYLLIRIGRQLFSTRYLAECVALYYSVVIAPAWCNELLTESLSMSLMIIMVYEMMTLLRKWSYVRAVGIHLLAFVMIMLRPTFLILLVVLPVVWTIFCLRSSVYIRGVILLMLGCFVGIGVLMYAQNMEQHFGKKSLTISFLANDVYILKNSGLWDIEAIRNKEAKEKCLCVDSLWTCNYEPLYRMVTEDSSVLALLDEACDDMKMAHRQEWFRYRTRLVIESFESRFPASVNTHSFVGCCLFLWSLLLAPPLSLFYLMLTLACVLLMWYVVRRKKVLFWPSVITMMAAMHCVGIMLSACEGFGRLMLPAYPLFLLIVGMTIDVVVVHDSKK